MTACLQNIVLTVTLLTVTVFYHLGGVDVFHHDSPVFSVSGHLWVDAIDAHVTFQSVKPSHFRRPLGRVPVTVVLSVLFVMCVSSRLNTCPHHDSRFRVRTELIGDTFAFPLMVSFLLISVLVFP